MYSSLVAGLLFAGVLQDFRGRTEVFYGTKYVKRVHSFLSQLRPRSPKRRARVVANVESL